MNYLQPNAATVADLQHVPDQSEYQATLNGKVVGRIEYTMRGRRVVILHTETDPEVQGTGIARALTRFALDDVRTRGLSAVPQCSYTQRFLRDHPEYTDVT